MRKLFLPLALLLHLLISVILEIIESLILHSKRDICGLYVPYLNSNQYAQSLQEIIRRDPKINCVKSSVNYLHFNRI